MTKTRDPYRFSSVTFWPRVGSCCCAPCLVLLLTCLGFPSRTVTHQSIWTRRLTQGWAQLALTLVSPGATVPSKAPSLCCTSSFSAPGWYVHTKLPPPPLGPGVPPDHLLRPMCVSTGPGEGQEVGMRPLDRDSQGPRAVWECVHLVTLETPLPLKGVWLAPWKYGVQGGAPVALFEGQCRYRNFLL